MTHKKKVEIIARALARAAMPRAISRHPEFFWKDKKRHAKGLLRRIGITPYVECDGYTCGTELHDTGCSLGGMAWFDGQD